MGQIQGLDKRLTRFAIRLTQNARKGSPRPGNEPGSMIRRFAGEIACDALERPLAARYAGE